MSEEQAAYGEEQTEKLLGVLDGAKKAMVKNALLKVKNGQGLAAHEAKLLAEFEETLKAKARGQEPAPTGDELRGIEQITAYLQGNGWKVTKSTLHRHIRAGRLRADEHGGYPKGNVDKYAIQWLKKQTDAEKVKAEKLAEEERKEKIGYQRALRKKVEMQLAVLEGKYVERDRMYLELAARAAVLDTGLKALAHLRAEAWVQACEGNHGRTAEFIRAVLADFDDLVNSFATTRQFQVMVGGREEGDRRQETGEKRKDKRLDRINPPSPDGYGGQAG